MPTRHGVPATLTSTGRVVSTWLPGEANALTGLRRWREVWHRLRLAHNRRSALRVLVAAWRHGVVLSGPAVR
jgi:hypothetical protein